MNDLLTKLSELAQKPFTRSRVKGPGYFGPLQRQEEEPSTELSAGVKINGREVEIPLLVPTLTKEELNHLLEGNQPTEVIMEKAVTHAKLRRQQKRDPFAQRGELEWPVLR